MRGSEAKKPGRERIPIQGEDNHGNQNRREDQPELIERNPRIREVVCLDVIFKFFEQGITGESQVSDQPIRSLYLLKAMSEK